MNKEAKKYVDDYKAFLAEAKTERRAYAAAVRLLEKAGFTVKRMVIEALCRDSSLRTASERGIEQTVYLIPIHKISDRWLERYFAKKAKMLKEALAKKKLPPVCSNRERWGGRKCLDFCEARSKCPFAQELQRMKLFKVG